MEEHRCQIESFSSIEAKYTSQIEKMNQEFSMNEKMYASQIKTLQDQHAEMEASFAKKIESHYTKYADLEKMHSFEMRKMSAQQREMVSKLESQIQKTLQEKIYLETHKSNSSIEIKKLFAINAELEKKLANKELEYHAIYESKEQMSKMESSQITAMSARLMQNEEVQV